MKRSKFNYECTFSKEDCSNLNCVNIESFERLNEEKEKGSISETLYWIEFRRICPFIKVIDKKSKSIINIK